MPLLPSLGLEKCEPRKQVLSWRAAGSESPASGARPGEARPSAFLQPCGMRGHRAVQPHIARSLVQTQGGVLSATTREHCKAPRRGLAPSRGLLRGVTLCSFNPLGKKGRFCGHLTVGRCLVSTPGSFIAHMGNEGPERWLSGQSKCRRCMQAPSFQQAQRRAWLAEVSSPGEHCH